MKTLRGLLSVTLAALTMPVLGQGMAANQARPGTVNYVEGQASVDGRAITQRSVGSLALNQGQYLATADGKAEILLTPGIFLRLDSNSTLQMVKPDLTHTEIRLEKGRASVEADQLYPQNMILIDQNGGQTQIVKNGLYEFNADASTVRTLDGKALVFPGNNLNTNVKPIDVKGGKQLALNGEPMKPMGFNKDQAQADPLYKWSSLRSDYLGEANVNLAASYGGVADFDPGWYWDSSLYAYDWLPGGYGPFWSPFGYGFYSPGYIWGGGFVYGRGYWGRGYGFRGGYGFSGARGGYAGYRGGAPVGASRGFSGGGGGFHGGGFGGGGGFHGGGGGGGHR